MEASVAHRDGDARRLQKRGAMVPHVAHAERVRSDGSVLIRHGATATVARVVDLAIDGARVRTELPGELVSHLEEPVQIDLWVDGSPPEHFGLRGRVVRAASRSKVFTISFDVVTERFEDRVQDALLAALEHDAAR